MSLPVIIIVILVGVTLVALEIVAIPGFICGLLGGAMVTVGIWQSYANFGTTAGIITLISSVVLCVIMLVILLKSGTWKRFSLNEASDGKANTLDNDNIRPGACGISISRLAPTGKAEIGGQIVEVQSESEFIDEQTPIEVIAVEGYRIVVKKSAE